MAIQDLPSSYLSAYSIDDALATYASFLANWAQTKHSIRSVWLFGSRVKGTNGDDSDLDVAIELKYPDPDTALAHWMHEQDTWARELAECLPIVIDLELYQAETTHAIKWSLLEASIKVYEHKS